MQYIRRHGTRVNRTTTTPSTTTPSTTTDTKASFNSLPVELCLEVIDYVLKDDPQNITRYTAVNKFFRVQCQSHALSRIRLGSGRRFNFNHLCEFVKTHYNNRPKQETPFRHVTSIHYRQGVSDEIHPDPGPYLSYLINLNELHLTGVCLKNMRAFEILGSTVRILSVNSHWMDDIDGLLTLLRSFTKLQHLTVDLPEFTLPLTSTPATFKEKKKKKTQPSEPQYPALPLRDLRLTSRMSIREVDHRRISEGDKLGKFLSLSRATLTTIEIHCESSVPRAGHMGHIRA